MVAWRKNDMSNKFPPEIQNLIDQYMASGAYSSENHFLQTALHVLSDYQATITDIRQGISEFEDGKAEPLSQAMDDIRRQLSAQQ